MVRLVSRMIPPLSTNRIQNGLALVVRPSLFQISGPGELSISILRAVVQPKGHALYLVGFAIVRFTRTVIEVQVLGRALFEEKPLSGAFFWSICCGLWLAA